ncbi:efflux RND transporter periplasmic adaptor subunit [Urechidicola vernalis]|uniref:Efflux RND transporter periplasmic adaptor subunit n=1 Tax=Urechidicola vernalis TaxID=3075600 RepID=A0ABU2Y1R0_9FLAO|nr:efflux RND transporter periplasmic adaptor subunit [Urechidicola sp. P050]MDT0551741.1 efflux RND transporter periplasmic adaptor subunit [Urechidicola sp. P050]
MKKILIFGTIAVLLIVVLLWFGKKNKASVIEYTTDKLITATIENKTVATGKVVPLEEVEIKPNISGIIDEIFLEEGVIVKKGDLIATVRVVPNEQSLNAAKGRISSVEIQVNNARISYERSKSLFDKGVIPRQEFENSELAYDRSKQDLANAQSDYQIILKGSAGSSGMANTNIRATTTGMILEIPVKEGYQVIQANNFNAGTTIASIADMSKMIFEGKVDEAEVGKLSVGIDLEVGLGAIEEKKFPAELTFIAPKGTEENGAVQFKIKADVELDEDYFVRANYSANADIVLEKKDSILAIKESLLQFDKKTEKPYVEIKTGEGVFERRDVEIGLSDGINAELISGVTEEDEIKVWNKASKDNDNNNN